MVFRGFFGVWRGFEAFWKNMTPQIFGVCKSFVTFCRTLFWQRYRGYRL